MNINKNIIKFACMFIVIITLGLAIAFSYNEKNTPLSDEKVPAKPVNTEKITVLNRTQEDEDRYFEKSIQSAETKTGEGFVKTTFEERERAPVLDEETWLKYRQELIRFIQAKNIEGARILCDFIYNGYRIENDNWYSLVTSGTFLEDFNIDAWSRQMTIGQMDDSVIYVLLFCQISTAEQAAFLPRMNMQVLPDGTAKDFYIQEVSEGGSYYSEAYRYFSDWDNTEVKKITMVYDDGSKYDIYIANNPEYGLRMITNIKRSLTDDIAVTYQDYFDFTGEEPYGVIYD